MLLNQNGIFYRKQKAEKPAASVIMIHGMGAHSGRFEELGALLASRRINGYSIELEGHGELMEGCHRQGHVGSIKVYHRCVKNLKKIVMEENPGLPVFMLGESMGGLIAAAHAASFDRDYAGLVLSAPAFGDKFSWGLKERLAIFLRSVISGSFGVKAPYRTEELTSDPVMMEKIRSDKKEHKTASANLLREILLSQLGLIFTARRIKAPVLLLLAGKDTVVYNNASLNFFRRLKCAKSLITYPEMLHALTIEKARADVFDDIVDWVARKAGQD